MCFSRERNQVGRVAVETLRVPLAQLKELLPTREGSCCRFARTRLLVRAENSPSMSLTLAVIKPDAFSRASSIEARLRAANFAVLARATITLLPSQVAELYEDVEGTPAYSKLLKLMTSGPVVALALEKSDAVAALSALMGPEDSGVAKSEVRTPSAFPWCFPPPLPLLLAHRPPCARANK